MSTELILTSVLLGVGLAMDAFSVSIANGLADRNMKYGRMLTIAGTFAAFQFAMPMIGWFVVKRMEETFEWFRPLIPWIALILLAIIGGGLLKDGIEEMRSGSAGRAGSGDGDEDAACEEKTAAGAAEAAAEMAAAGKAGAAGSVKADETEKDEPEDAAKLTALMLFGQGVATSIDALSVGFTTAEYNAAQAFASSLIIGAVTLAICMAGLRIGRKLGELLAGRASILGGIILIGIGLEIWIRGVFF